MDFLFSSVLWAWINCNRSQILRSRDTKLKFEIWGLQYHWWLTTRAIWTKTTELRNFWVWVSQGRQSPGLHVNKLWPLPNCQILLYRPQIWNLMTLGPLMINYESDLSNSDRALRNFGFSDARDQSPLCFRSRCFPAPRGSSAAVHASRRSPMHQGVLSMSCWTSLVSWALTRCWWFGTKVSSRSDFSVCSHFK